MGLLGRLCAILGCNAGREVPGSLASGFRRVVRQQRSARAFQNWDLSSSKITEPDRQVKLQRLDECLLEALSLAQRAPSGFNIQPYRAVVVRDSVVKKQLAYAMVGGNIKRVLDAPVSVVWLADTKPWKLIDPMIEMERKAGTSEVDLANLRSDASFLLGSSSPSGPQAPSNPLLSAVLPKVPDLQGASHSLEMFAKRSLLSAMSQVTQAVTINESAESWSFKNTMMACQIFLLAMRAHGYDSCPMEGFDATRVKRAVGAPLDRYSVPIIVSSGIAEWGGSTAEKPSDSKRPRHSFEEVFSADTFHFPLSPKDS